ncbi:UDP-N-acetylglucosamine--undecaprenyl-phosphate N-acetylglucosaminephosphotransferase [Shewanella sp. FJAT-52076]|uniref:UDP-N-acetylglucosamine--undecaprenyl-phosphate N-acetylglucosaminephosphotransferase n=1 Tax=Shewanella sp. FJAT-52076 TaxID=2864202 RepID=UPI001C66217E|nr:UDP-N-acetylglucosamine--undecaprenyl-phosphate N-acetylglucosaminephosphotransferase [Shewanella sp. FJAT-52076]QYJ74060.1 UDP-N-acetylglucosamine--undecaprenyl-phosphate N-acetylglucosaminephosphotransferase [Shewanella sp. FJAT-52076]
MDIFLPLITAFVLSFASVKFVHPLAVKAGLVDIPNGRKQHVGEIPLIGGVSIYLSVMMCSVWFMPGMTELHVYLVSAAMLLFIGVLDDRYDLPVRYRLVAQILVASIMIFGGGLYISHFGDLLMLGDIRLGKLGILVTVLAVVGAINAYNMIDGIDGLAGSLSAISFTALALLLGSSGSDWYLLPILFIAALVAYLMFNLGWPDKRLAKIFMGDAGSMLIGLTIVWLLVIGVNGDAPSFRPVTALYIIAVPLMDMAAIMYRRIKKGDSPFKPDRDHLHHIFMRAGCTPQQALGCISLISALLAGVGFIGELVQIPESVMFFGYLVLFVTYCFVIQHIWQILSWIRSKGLV